MLAHLNIVCLLACFLLSVNVSAYWRLPCMGVVARGLIDPIVAPGEFSPHLHTVKGASGKCEIVGSISSPNPCINS